MWFLPILVILIVHHTTHHSVVCKSDQKLLIILADAMRYDYVNDSSLPTIGRLLETGVRVPYVQPAYPTISYPNWYTISTGMFIETHGMTGNDFYDPDCNCSFSGAPDPSSQNPRFWNEAEPIWVTAEKQGVKTAMFWWDGCSVVIRGHNASYCEPYDADHTFWKWWESGRYERDYLLATSQIAEHFKNDDWQLAMMYYEALDGLGHRFGPRSEETSRGLMILDRVIDNFLNAVDYLGIGDKVNIVIVADHGMTYGGNATGQQFKVIELSNMFNPYEAFWEANDLAYAQIWPAAGDEGELYAALLEQSIATGGFSVYQRDNIPQRLHFSRNHRISPIHVMTDPGYILDNSTFLGYHGFDAYKVHDMMAGFVAQGPGILKGYESHKPLVQTDHYNLFCYLLGIQPEKNNGTFSNIADFLVPRYDEAISELSKEITAAHEVSTHNPEAMLNKSAMAENEISSKPITEKSNNDIDDYYRALRSNSIISHQSLVILSTILSFTFIIFVVV